MHSLWVDQTPGLFLTEENNTPIHKQLLGRERVVILSTKHQEKSGLGLHRFTRQNLYSIHCQGFTLKTEMKQQQFVSFRDFCNREEGRIQSMYGTIDYLGILLKKIHEELHLPPLFLLTQIIPLNSIPFFVWFLFFQREWVHILLKG